MIKSVTVTNHVGDSLQLILREPEKSGLIITDIDGLGPIKASINTTNYATLDGAYFNSSRGETRNINITLRPMDPDVEGNRLKAYRFFPVKEKVKIEVITDNRDGVIEGYVESVEPTIFSDEESIDISIICPDPFFYEQFYEEILLSLIHI